MRLFAMLLLLAGLLPGCGAAQDAAPQPPDQNTIPEQVPQSGSSGRSLSDRLSRSNGVIAPPVATDPGSVKPPSQSGAPVMPVLPPPGAPGGDPSVQPK